MRKFGLDRERLRMLAGQEQETFEAGLCPLLERREGVAREVERARSRIESLLELAEDCPISKQKFAVRRARLESERDRLGG